MPLPRNISTTLLLSRPARVDLGQLRRALESRLAPNCPDFSEMEWRRKPLLCSKDMHLLLGARDLPVGDERLDSALCSGLSALLREDPAASVARHRAALTITVGVGSDPEDGRKRPAGPTQELFDRMLILAHAAANRLAHDLHPLALHWSQSDQIVSPSRFAAMSGMLFPLPLFLHARPERFERGNGESWLGLEIGGARHLIGHGLRTAPAPVDLAWMMQRVYAFVAHLRATGQTLEDGTAFAMAEGERFVLRRDGESGMCLVLTELNGAKLERPDEFPKQNAA